MPRMKAWPARSAALAPEDVGAAAQAVATGLEPDAPPEGQVTGGRQLVKDDRPVPDRGPDHPVARVVQGHHQLVQGGGVHQPYAARADRVLHGGFSCLLGGDRARPFPHTSTGSSRLALMIGGLRWP